MLLYLGREDFSYSVRFRPYSYRYYHDHRHPSFEYEYDEYVPRYPHGPSYTTYSWYPLHTRRQDVIPRGRYHWEHYRHHNHHHHNHHRHHNSDYVEIRPRYHHWDRYRYERWWKILTGLTGTYDCLCKIRRFKGVCATMGFRGGQ
jgi:hypothetical protein